MPPAPRRPPDVLALCYHAVSDRWPEVVAIHPERLEAQLRDLLARGWVPATFSEAVTDPPARRTLAVTFDDAFRSVCRLAAPILERLGVPATMFVPTGFVSDGRPLSWPRLDRWAGTPYEPELEPASWAEIAQLQAAGWEIGSHTVSHPRLTRLPAESLDRELCDSRDELEGRLSTACRSIAYPYGDTDGRVARAAEAAGYRTGAALLPARLGADPLRVGRVFIPLAERPGLHRLHLWRPVRWLQARGAWPPVPGPAQGAGQVP